MKMFKMMAASMLGVALCLGFTACSDDDENENGEGGENTATVVNPSQVFTGGLPKSVSGMAISHNEEGLVLSRYYKGRCCKGPSKNHRDG